MAFTLTGGSLTFDIVPTITIVRGRTDRGTTESWALEGRLIASGSTAILAKVNALEAVAIDDVKWTLKDGALTLREPDPNDVDMESVNADISYPDGTNAQFVTNRAYSISIISMRRGWLDDTIAFVETVSLDESILRSVFHEILAGRRPIQQTTSQKPAVITQSGSATGWKKRPAFPAFLFPANTLTGNVRSKAGPRLNRNGELREFGITWNYTFTLVDVQTTVKEPTTHPGF